ncbi:hypothetical protein OS493_002305 [Desmophyllum pertusum]|uniref:Uncharacterized protein n=1 Tax=Desmophyllum pertusum TaxID=174260 RepID=A0A9W9YST0_9CNID|nr:hypothetical protein OS493_002305 [Desmophyllum pertusum]
MDLREISAEETLATVEEEGPEFNEYVLTYNKGKCQALVCNAEDTRAKATKGSMIAESRIITAGKEKIQKISVGDIGLIEVPKEDRVKHGQRNLLVQVVAMENHQLVLAPLLESGLGPKLHVRYSTSDFVKVENCNADQKNLEATLKPLLGGEKPTVGQWKQEYFRRRVLAAEIYAYCVEDYNIMFFLSAGESSFTVNEKLLNSSEPSPVLASSEVFDWVKEALRHCLTKPIESDRQECILAILLLAVEAAKENRRVLDLEKCRAMHTETKRFLSELPIELFLELKALPMTFVTS